MFARKKGGDIEPKMPGATKAMLHAATWLLRPSARQSMILVMAVRAKDACASAFDSGEAIVVSRS